ncbi:MAG: hypothetical protein JXB15_08905 [Anaerolineales bacterium]|nr:hypothetical protein [Anaerolineales bacterium]
MIPGKCGIPCFVQADRRFAELLAAITAQADAQGRYIPTGMYQVWKGWGLRR